MMGVNALKGWSSQYCNNIYIYLYIYTVYVIYNLTFLFVCLSARANLLNGERWETYETKNVGMGPEKVIG